MFKRIMSSLVDQIIGFFGELKERNRPVDNPLSNVAVVRDPSLSRDLPKVPSRLAAIQPKVERDLVGVGELPTMSLEQYKQDYKQEDAKDKAPTNADDSSKSYLDALREALHKEEGGSLTNAYIPMRNGVPIGKSGVTIGKGFDLGQFDIKGLRNLGLGKQVIEKLRPYLNVRGTAAARVLRERPLTLSEEEVKALNTAVFNKKSSAVENLVNRIEAESGRKLSDNQKVALGSMYYQGINPESFPNTFRLMSQGKWDEARESFLNSKWARHQTPERARRTIEALFKNISLKEAEERLSSLGEIDQRRRVFSS